MKDTLHEHLCCCHTCTILPPPEELIYITHTNTHTEEETLRLPMTLSTLNNRISMTEVNQPWSSIPAVIKLQESKVCFSQTLRPTVMFERVQRLHLATADTEVKGCAPVSVNLFRLNNTLLSCVAWQDIVFPFFPSCYCVARVGNIARHYVVFAGCPYTPPCPPHPQTPQPPH